MAADLVLKGQTFGFVDDPFVVGPDAAVRHIPDGAVWMADGRIRRVGPAAEVLAEAHGVAVVDHGDSLIQAGFVDCHAHYPQLGVIAAYGTQLLDWLERYTFPEERRFADIDYAAERAAFYLDACLANGTTTASVFGTVHPQSVDAFFQAAEARGLRMACGKSLMDRNAPDGLRDTAIDGYDQSKALIDRWHGRGRNIYAVTCRFAVTSTPEQMEATGALWREAPGAVMQTHLSENHDEIAWVARLFPDAADYLAVYQRYGLAGPGAIFGHAIHLTERERRALAETGSAVAHCPTSNLFIGSGLMDLAGLKNAGVGIGLATDVAGGSSLSMFQTMRAAYEVAQLRGHSLHPAEAWHLATVESARAMGVADRVGNLAEGMEADVIVIDPRSTPIIRQRVARAESLWDVLFAQMILADDRAIRAAYVAGAPACAREGTL